MTDLKISELEDGGSSQAADAIPIARSGQNYYVTSQYLKNFVFGSNGTISIAAGKTFSVNNTITLNGNDGVSVNFGSGGTFLYDGGPLGVPSSGTMTNVTGLPLTTGVTGTLPVVNGGTGITSFGTGVATALGQNVTGSGSIVLSNSPTLVTPALGTPSSAILANATGLPISTGVDGLGSGVATFLETPSSANLRSAITDETGAGALVFGTGPTIGSPTLTGTATFIGSTSGTVTVKAAAIAGTTTFQLPASNGTSGYVLVTDGLGNTSWASAGGAAGNAAGIDKNVQFNDAGSMAGNAALNFDKSTASLSLGTASVTTGKLAFYNGATANATTIQAGSASAAVTYTLPTADGTNGQALITNGSGALSWTTVASGLTVGTTAITGGTSGRILYDNAGTLGEKAVTGTGDVVLATSPTLITPLLGTPTSGNLSNCTNIPVNQATGTLPVANGGTGLTAGTSGGVLYYSASGTLASSAALAVSSIVLGGGAGSAPATTTTGTGVVTAIGNNTNAASGLAVLNGSGYLAVAQGGTGLGSGTSGGVLYYSASGTLASSSALSSNALVIGGGAGAAPSTTTTGAGILTFLGTPSSANLAAAVTDETGTGSLVFSNSPTFNDDITLGVVSTATGIANFKGTTSGTVSLSVYDTAGTWTMKLPTSGGTNGQALVTDGSGNTSWGAAGATIQNDTTTATAVYPVFSNATTGTLTTAYTSNAKLLYTPSTGILSAVAVSSTNGISLNAMTIAADFTVPTNYNGGSFGPVTIDTGITVTVSSGSTYTVV